jgi:tetratricopeptide (TPR) repeat protein
MIFAKINAESADSVVKQQYNVSAYPTFVITESNGNEIDRIVGYMEAIDFLATVNNYREGIGTLADLLSKAEDSDDRTLFFEIADKYKYNGGADDAKVWYQKVIDAGDAQDSLSAESRFSLADMFRRAKDYDSAIKAYENIKTDFDNASYQEEADIWIAIVYRYKADTVMSIQKFEEFMTNYPESEDLEYAEKQIRRLKGEVVEEE